MSYLVRVWRSRLVAEACYLLAGAAVALVGAAPVLAKPLHGGAHGRVRVLMPVHTAPVTTAELIALGAVLVVACTIAGIVAYRRRLTRRAAPVVRLPRESAAFDQATSQERTA